MYARHLLMHGLRPTLVYGRCLPKPMSQKNLRIPDKVSLANERGNRHIN
jgi:hypothetical protein